MFKLPKKFVHTFLNFVSCLGETSSVALFCYIIGWELNCGSWWWWLLHYKNFLSSVGSTWNLYVWTLKLLRQHCSNSCTNADYYFLVYKAFPFLLQYLKPRMFVILFGNWSITKSQPSLWVCLCVGRENDHVSFIRRWDLDTLILTEWLT